MKTIVLTFGVFFTLISCGTSEEPQGKIYQTKGIAIDGYDPVAYFEQGEAKLGDENTLMEYGGTIYHFSSTENKALFEQDPDKYIPEYGGWCAYAIAETSTKMEPDPTMWQIQDGKLLLFYDDWMSALTGNLKDKWNEDRNDYIIKANKNWLTMSTE